MSKQELDSNLGKIGSICAFESMILDCKEEIENAKLDIFYSDSWDNSYNDSKIKELESTIEFYDKSISETLDDLRNSKITNEEEKTIIAQIEKTEELKYKFRESESRQS